MKFFLTICILLISIPAAASTEQSGKRDALLTRTQTKEAERLLADLGYWTGPVDGIFDSASQSALIAFQKWESRPVTAKLTLEELEAMSISASPKAREPGYAHVEVDVDRQVLLLINDEGDVRILPVSTGSDQPFQEEGQMSMAYTPRGRFLVYDKVAGWEKGALGAMFYSSYISGGVAIHGSPNVPIRPASHGCIRVPMFAAREMSKLLPVGTIVLVYDKVSFVSGRPWAQNPDLKQAALLASESPDYTYDIVDSKTRPRFVIKRARSRIMRAGLRVSLGSQS
jgi:peptidoglycan hydrolase-like protein with peptidoglycan-binding domain